MPKKKTKILTPNNALVINDMISKNTGRKREILIELKKLNADANKFMTMPYSKYGSKYSLLPKEECWKQAKKLLIDYFDNDLICKVCQKKIDNHDCILHHSTYKLQELFTPLNIEFLHDKCHEIIHKK